MERTIRMLLAAAVSAMAAASCSVQELDIPEPAERQEKVKIQVIPSIQGMDDVQTKSAVTSGESAVKDINIFFYHNGLLVASSYVVTPSVATFLLNEGLDYNVYAVANVGKITPIDKEDDMVRYRMTIGSSGFVGTMNSDGIPMVWQKSGYTVDRSITQLPMALVRLVSKIRFRVDMKALAGLRVTSIRLCNGAGAVTPFTMNGHGGSRITSQDESIDGDYASAADLAAINSGGQIFFYALENCQGTLLTGNTDPWKKTPENISVAGLCTYLEVNCEFQSGFALNGTITYRVYLGQDNCTNFDIIRNVDMGVTLCLTKNLDNVSWKIDPDVDYNGSLGQAWVEQGYHRSDNLYIGETVQLGLSFNSYLEDFLGDSLRECRLAVVMGDDIFDGFTFGTLTLSSGDWYCDMKCLDRTLEPCSLWLIDRNGEMITDITLEDGEIDSYMPYLMAGDGGVKKPSDRISAPQMNACPVVNGSDTKVHLYLADYSGRNLNVPKSQGQYGFDLSLFDRLEMTSTASVATTSRVGHAAASLVAGSYVLQGVSQGTSQSGGPAFTCSVRSGNTGRDATLNDALSRVYHMDDGHDGSNHVADLKFHLPNAYDVTAKADFGIVRPKFFLADQSTFTPSNGYMITGKTLVCAYNPSAIDYQADVIYLGRRKSTATSDKVDGARQVNYRSEGVNPGYYLPTAVRVNAYPYISDCSSMVLRNASPTASEIVIEGKKCNVFATDRTGGVSALSEKDGNKAWMRAEVGICTTGGKEVMYDYEDLNGAFVTSDGSVSSNATYSYTWGNDTYSYQGCGWYTGEGMKTAVNANRDSYAAAALNYSGANVYNIMMRQPVRFEVSWDSSLKRPVVNMTGNTLGARFTVYVGLVYTSSCTAAQNTGASSTKYTYTVTDPQKNTTIPSFTYSLSGASASTGLPNYAIVENQFAYMNKNYWHENCTNAINLRSNRFSQMAMPESVEYCITITVEDKGLWVPVEITATEPSGNVTTSAYTFYTHTAKGTYADTSSMTNPDGSSRGNNSGVSDQAAKYGDYSSTTGSYKVKFNVMHDQYWNRYDM